MCKNKQTKLSIIWTNSLNLTRDTTRKREKRGRKKGHRIWGSFLDRHNLFCLPKAPKNPNGKIEKGEEDVENKERVLEKKVLKDGSGKDGCGYI